MKFLIVGDGENEGEVRLTVAPLSGFGQIRDGKDGSVLDQTANLRPPSPSLMKSSICCWNFLTTSGRAFCIMATKWSRVPWTPCRWTTIGAEAGTCSSPGPRRRGRRRPSRSRTDQAHRGQEG